jgi:hypothetical protein
LGEEDDAVLGRSSETRGEVAELPRHVLMQEENVHRDPARLGVAPALNLPC